MSTHKQTKTRMHTLVTIGNGVDVVGVVVVVVASVLFAIIDEDVVVVVSGERVTDNTDAVADRQRHVVCVSTCESQGFLSLHGAF